MRDPRRAALPSRRCRLGAGAAASIVTAGLLLTLLPAALPAQLRAVTTVPDLADMVAEIGGERVVVDSLARGTENLHAVAVRPSMLVAMNRADLFFEMGLSLESTWLPDLLIAARNPRIQPGGSGFVNCSEGWDPIEVPASLSRKEGDLHPQGNPHFNLDPRAGPHLARRVLEALVTADPGNEAGYRQRHADYLGRLEQAGRRWRERGAALAGQKVVVYHVEFNYLVRYHDMELVTAVEPKPGIPPGPRDVSRVIQLVREAKVPVILTAAWSNNRQVAEVARKGGAQLLELPNQVGGAPWATSWIDLIDGIQLRLLEAYGASPP